MNDYLLGGYVLSCRVSPSNSHRLTEFRHTVTVLHTQFRKVCPDQRNRERRWNCISAAGHLLRFRVEISFAIHVNDVVRRESLRGEQFPRRQHTHPNIDDLIIDAVNCYQPESVLTYNGVKRLRYLLAGSLSVILNQECLHFCKMPRRGCDCM